jgi:penicillin-binding protein 2
MLNRAIQAQWAPGSTFKPFVALSALETGTIDDKFQVHCPGGVTLYGHYYHCWEKHGHGTVALHSGIVHSCDVYFYTIGSKEGIDNIAFYADLAGMGHTSGIDLPHEAAGVVPSEKWKLRNFRQKWYAGETPSVAIGQGALTVTPLQLARGIGGLAMGGVWQHPHLLKVPESELKPAVWQLNQDNVRAVVDGMYGVVNEGGGTGGRARLPYVDVCGKTGSAQVASNDVTKGSSARNLKDNGWFEAFAPCHAPEIVVVALFEHGEHGALAAPIAKDVMMAYFDKKKRLAEQLQAEQKNFAGKMAVLGNIVQPTTHPADALPPDAPSGPEE